MEDMDIIISRACEMCGVGVTEFLSPCRRRNLVVIREILTAYLHDERGMGWCELSRLFNRHHATIIHCYKSYHNDILDKDFKRKAETIINSLSL